MRPVYLIAGGITKFAKAHPDKDFRFIVNAALDCAPRDLGGKLTSVNHYFSDHFIKAQANP